MFCWQNWMYYSFSIRLAFTCHNKKRTIIHKSQPNFSCGLRVSFSFPNMWREKNGKNTNHIWKTLILSCTKTLFFNDCYYYFYGESNGWAFLKHGRKRVWDIRLWIVVEFMLTFVDVNFFQQENGHVQRMTPFQAPSMGWPGVQGIQTTPVVKRVIRLDVPVEKYPSVS